MSVTIDHTFTWPVGQSRAKGDWNLLDTPAVRGIVSDDTHSERKIIFLSLIGQHNRLEITSSATHGVAIEVVHGICVEGDQIYGMPFVAGESYQFTIVVASGSTIDGEWRIHNTATGHIQINTTGVTNASEQDKTFQHDHPHDHRDYLQTFNTIFARLDRLTPNLPAGSHTPAPSDGDDNTDDSSGSST